MQAHLIRSAALGYLNQWDKTDLPLATRLRADTHARDLALDFHELATKYNVVRNFDTKEAKKTGPKEVDRLWGKVARAVCAVEVSEDSPEKQVHALAKKLGEIFPRSSGKRQPFLLSAATKFLWFRGHTSIRIYDKRAVDALNALIKARGETNKVNGDYKEFADEWETEYKRLLPNIRTAIRELPDVAKWSGIPEGKARDQALKDCKRVWFRDRVFDKYLWALGEKD
ncbi:hypothetical protein GTP81_20815 [Rugamonas sp. FT107W]|uniref:Uncharacterized protein n=1 Tax=Duganella vulcania TaxID=2692166 RepID=A0A845HKD7_9BURK|nr:hypothetical protein [Duganella vulcania]MYN19198.1 hypothetical protein [Duganella vulcania]